MVGLDGKMMGVCRHSTGGGKVGREMRRDIALREDALDALFFLMRLLLEKLVYISFYAFQCHTGLYA